MNNLFITSNLLDTESWWISIAKYLILEVLIMWICPICQLSLRPSESQWRCANGHGYDVAKEGYVNLLLTNEKKSRDPGDNQVMVNSRRQFLEQGHYDALVQKLAAIIQHRFETGNLSLYDAGCGEGYYLQKVSEALLKPDRVIKASGSDISKVGVRKAAKKYAAHAFVVASSFNLPVAESSQDVVLQIFAPGSDDELHRVLSEGGLWLRVTPSSRHLFELKQALYQSPLEHLPDESMPSGFKLLGNENLCFKFLLQDLRSREQLLMMTPYYWTVKQGALPTVLDKMRELTADFNIRVLQKYSALDPC